MIDLLILCAIMDIEGVRPITGIAKGPELFSIIVG